MKIFTRIKFLLLSLFVIAGISNALAQVVITRPTGAETISNNLSRGSSVAAYTQVGDIVIQETAPGNFASNPNLRVLTLARPNANWEFLQSGVTVETLSGEITDLTVIESTERIIKIQYRVPNATTGGNRITIKGVALQSLNRTVATAQNGSIYIYADPDDASKGHTRGVISGIVHGTATTGTKVATVTKVVGGAYQLLALMPGQTINSGNNATGKSGAVMPRPIAGDVVNVKVYATDYGWYPVASSLGVSLVSNDDYAVLPAGPNNLNGTTTGTDFPVQLRTSTNTASRTVTVSDNANLIAPTTTTATRVDAGANTQVLAIFPGETYTPGSPTGKINAPTAPVVGLSYAVSVRSVDAFFNTVSSTNNITMSAANVTNPTLPASGNMAAGVRNVNFVFKIAGEIPQITAFNNTNSLSYIQSVPAVVAGTYARLVTILPGEIEKPGIAAGKEGTANPQVAGVPFAVKVIAVDAFGNKVDVDNEIVFSATQDTYAVLPSSINLVNGELNTSATYRTAHATTNRTIVAADNAAGRTGSSTFKVNFGDFDKLLVIMPGEAYAAGHLNGKTGSATDRAAGTAFTVIVRAVDAANNTLVDRLDVVQLTTTDVDGTFSTNSLPLQNGARTFTNTATLRTLGVNVSTITASNGDNTKNYTTAPITVVAGAYARLVVILPGETEKPGISAGKEGTPDPQVAGVPFAVKVIAVDAAGNKVDIDNEIVFSATQDAYAVLPSATNLVDGELNTTATYRTAHATTNRTLVASDPSIANRTGSSAFKVDFGDFDKLLVIMPGETYIAGHPNGKTGMPTDRTAYGAFTVIVRAVDAGNNTLTGRSDVIQLTTTDALGTFASNNLPLQSGVRTFTNTATLRTIGVNVSTITASNGDNTKNYITAPITVVAGAYARLVVILPGETEKPGIAAGKEGTPSPQVAGVPFAVKVIAIDANGNKVNVNNQIVFSATGTVDAYAQVPATANLVSGELNTTATYRTAGTGRRLTATDNNVANRSGFSSFTLNTGAYARLLIVLPGETYTAGHPDGKIGPAGNQGQGVAFTITVRATDIAFNQIIGPTSTIQITSTDSSFGVVPATGNLSATTGQRTFSVTLGTIANTNTLTAAVVPSGSILSNTTAGISILNPSLASDLFRSAVASGNWNNSASWETFTGGAWQPSTLVPTTNSTGVTIRSTNTINVISTITIDDLTIENGGQLNVNTGGTIDISNGLAGTDAIVAGILRSNGRPININTGAVLQFSATGKYQHNFTTTSGTIPTANWATGSTCEIVGYTTFAGDVAGSNQAFSDFVWNAPQSAAGSPSLLSGFSARNFTVTRTNSGTLNLGSVGGTTVITGNYVQTAGNVRANKTSGTQAISFGGDFAINGGTFALGSGTVNVTYNGNSQSLSNAGTTIEFGNVTFTSGGTKTLTSGSFNLAATGVLTMGESTDLNANGNLTVLSNASSTGTIAAIPASSQITGNVTVQRFITGGNETLRTYRMFSSPVYDNGNASNRTYSHAQFIDDMIVTGAGGASNGFDTSPFNNASAWVYTPGATPAFQDVTNINTSLNVGKGAYVYYRGDKSNPTTKYTAPYAVPESIAMDFVGVLNQQDVVVPLSNGGNLVGNPFASSIDWNSPNVVKTNLSNNIIRIWNPASRTYATYDGNIGVPGDIAGNIIPAGQGFFVQSNAGGSITFRETAKIGVQAPVLLMSTPTTNIIEIKNKMAENNSPTTQNAPTTTLRLVLTPNGSQFNEETAVVFQAGRNAAYNAAEDATYLSNPTQNEGGQKVFLSSLSADDRNLVINYMPEVANGSSVKLNINALNPAGDYKLAVKYQNVPAGYAVKLHDQHLITSTAVQSGDIYAFTIDKNVPASFGANRFSVSFEAPNTLPVTYSSFTAAKVNEGVQVKWSTATETNNDRFEVERAGDDKVFEKLQTVVAKGSGSTYSYIDRNPIIGNNYYRLVQHDKDGKNTATDPQVVNFTGGLTNATALVSIFPNPVVSKFTVKFNGVLKANQQTLKIVSATGQVVLTKEFSKAQLLSGQDIDIASFASGVYIVEVYEGGTQRVGQMKLIKQ